MRATLLRGAGGARVPGKGGGAGASFTGARTLSAPSAAARGSTSRLHARWSARAAAYSGGAARRAWADAKKTFVLV
jgi:hypothetical protein